MKSNYNTRAIDRRPIPPVAGIDLEQALNYLDLRAVGEEFIYGHYTHAHVLYVPGSRPALEAAANEAVGSAQGGEQAVRALTAWVARRVRWAGFFRRDTGRRLPADRAATEEQILVSGYGWCNEQARLFCALTQVLGWPSRLVFASNPESGYGHVIAEVLLQEEGWLAADPSLGFCFFRQGLPVRASRIFHDPASRAFFGPVYTSLCRELIQDLGPDAATDFAMAAAANPLDGFTELGFHNFFLR